MLARFDQPLSRLRLSWLKGLSLLLPLLLGLLHWAGIWKLHFIDAFEYFLEDTRQQTLLTKAPETPINLIQIDEKSLAEIGRWPWSRDKLARLNHELLQRQKATTVGWNMVFTEADAAEGLHLLSSLALGPLHHDTDFLQEFNRLSPQLNHDARFAESMRGQKVVLGYYLNHGQVSSDPLAMNQAGQLPEPITAQIELSPLHRITRWTGYGANLAMLTQAAPRAGFFNVLTDTDGIVRSIPLVAAWQPPNQPASHIYQAFSLAVMRSILNDPKLELMSPDGLVKSHLGWSAIRLRQGPSILDIPIDERGAVRIPFRPNSQFKSISAADVLWGRLPAASLQGQLALVGTTAVGLADVHPTPLGPSTPGLVIHASVIAGLLDGHLPIRPDWARGFEVLSLILGCLLLAWILPRAPGSWPLLITLLSLVGWVGLNVLLYRATHWVLPFTLPLVATATTATLAIVLNYLNEAHSRRALARLFGAYVPPELVSQMALDPERYTRAGLGADNRELTILFCDLRHFTRVAEQLQPEQLREVVNLFFSRMSAVIAQHGGTLDKYIGDAVMAFWGAPIATPHHAAQAVRASLDMLAALEKLNLDLRQRGLPELSMGLGLNTGIVCVGELGSDNRRSYSVIGDAVNLAARIESLTRQLHMDLLVGENTYRAAHGQTADLPWRMVEQVEVRGRAEPVTLYTPLATSSAHA